MNVLTVETRAGTKTLAYHLWNGQVLRSSRNCPLAFDTETEMIRDGRHVPRLALATASDGTTHVVIHPDRLADFLVQHKDAWVVGHNVQFDFWVVDQHLRQAGQDQAQRVLWDLCNRGQLFDTQVLDMLLQLATGKFRHAPGARREEAKVYPGSLADVAADYTTLQITKDDPYRGRFGELLGLCVEALKDVDPGFFTYAVRDALTTRRLYPALAQAAYEQMLDCGFKRHAQRYGIRPDALERFGHLSEVVQVKASVVLAYLSRRGVRIDLERVRDLGARFRAELAEAVRALERDYPEVLTYDKDGTLQLSPKSPTPSMGPKKRTPLLQRVVEELRARGVEIQIPVSKGKKGGISQGTKDWAPYADQHSFLSLWTRVDRLGKRLAFLERFTAPVLHGEYSLLTRTGRTSCSAPRSKDMPGLNIQQTPREPSFRALFIPSAGHRLFTGDFVAAELRTLAAVCKARYGSSRLGEVIAEGTDPHAYTAAMILGTPLAEFMALKGTDPKRFKQARQAAKALNFGIPGGLGPQTLVEYARATYGVTLTNEQAKQFRQKLTTEIYPELDKYLADDGMAALARNLGVTEREAWEVFDGSGQRNPLAARGVTNVIRGKSSASPYYQARVWDGLFRLARTVHELNPEVADRIASREGCPRLHDRLYWQSVATLTGRVRSGVSYTEARNTPFQSLAADGGKLALWNLLYAGFDVYGFIHDEILVELPAEKADEKAQEVERIMVRSMEEVMGQGVPAECEYVVEDCWTKA
jgi:hypothetical protein